MFGKHVKLTNIDPPSSVVGDLQKGPYLRS